MTDEDIIKTAIEKAVGNGYPHERLANELCSECGGLGTDDNANFVCTVCKGTGASKELHAGWLEQLAESPEFILFDHGFAEAFWGRNRFADYKWAERHCTYSWQYHLQELAITPPEERLAYIAKFLDQ